ncbi:MAG: hypothetical protein C0418_00380 [Coriobacteriaceae bacterium]|nr:hypothetical protein [Coriobacteriaceae bacterium]
MPHLVRRPGHVREVREPAGGGGGGPARPPSRGDGLSLHGTRAAARQSQRTVLGGLHDQEDRRGQGVAHHTGRARRARQRQARLRRGVTSKVARSPLVVGLAGSPRRHGNSEQLLDAFLEGARGAGAEVRKIPVVELGLTPCRGCNACSSTGECVLRDRMSEIYGALDAADAVVVGSPVFFATVPGVLKVAYDRCQPYWARTHVLGLPKPTRRPGALLLVRGGGDPYGFRSAVEPTKSVFAVLGLDMVGLLKVAGPDSPSDMGRRPEESEHARELGAALVEAVPEGA